MAFEWTFPNYNYYFFYKICFVMLSCFAVYRCNFMHFNLLLIIFKVQTKLSLLIVWKAVECSDLFWILIIITMPMCTGRSDAALKWSKVIVCRQQMHDFFCPLLYLLAMKVTDHTVLNLRVYKQSKQTIRSSVIHWNAISITKHTEYILK